MMGGWMVFGEIISFVGTAFAPKNLKLFLSDADMIMDPIKMHINCFGAFLFDGVIGDATCSTVISLDRNGGWGWPNSSRVVRMGQASLQLRNSAPILLLLHWIGLHTLYDK